MIALRQYRGDSSCPNKQGGALKGGTCIDRAGRTEFGAPECRTERGVRNLFLARLLILGLPSGAQRYAGRRRGPARRQIAAFVRGYANFLRARLVSVGRGLTAVYVDIEIWRVRPHPFRAVSIEFLLVTAVKRDRCPLAPWADDPEGMMFAADLADIVRVIREAKEESTP
jgi:hypothetical protein